MRTAAIAARKLEATARTYAIFARHAEVELAPLPVNVTVVADSRCVCREDGCYFCDALDFAVWEQARLADEQEQEERWGSRYAGWWED